MWEKVREEVNELYHAYLSEFLEIVVIKMFVKLLNLYWTCTCENRRKNFPQMQATIVVNGQLKVYWDNIQATKYIGSEQTIIVSME